MTNTVDQISKPNQFRKKEVKFIGIETLLNTSFPEYSFFLKTDYSDYSDYQDSTKITIKDEDLQIKKQQNIQFKTNLSNISNIFNIPNSEFDECQFQKATKEPKKCKRTKNQRNSKKRYNYHKHNKHAKKDGQTHKKFQPKFFH